MIWYVILFPLLGAVVNGFFLRNANKKISHLVAVAAMGLSFLCALIEFSTVIGGGHTDLPKIYHGFEWLAAAGIGGEVSFEAPFALALDQLSGFMMLIITGIGTLIHIYAGGYMHDEPKTSRFFAYLNLFIFMMLLLVLGDNLMVTFVGWEGVGLCSYLLIGYWFSERANADAGMKAFIVNRIGDIGFLLAVFLIYKNFGTVSFSQLKDITMSEGSLGLEITSSIPWIALCLFVGVTGKSAQIPLFVWLPDAMAGPTPVSALIHAATMVTAGVYLMTRMSFMFFLTPEVMSLVAAVGAVTALFSATIAMTQTDIKKVLAYSTVSQLGFMVLGCGVGAFGAGVFHLLTHACFKALLFLGAGSVIVAMHHKQEMGEMGGLRKYLPKTHAAFLVGVLAIIGTPGLSGFFSKDEILWHAFLVSPVLWAIGVLAAGLTAFYMVRLYCLTFLGENRSDDHTKEHLHETPATMWGPLFVLAALSISVGWLGIPAVLGGDNFLHHYFEPIVQVPAQAREYWAFLSAPHSHNQELLVMSASVLVAAIAAISAFILYRKGPSVVAANYARDFPRTFKLLLNKYYIDEFFEAQIVRPLHDLSTFLYRIIDAKIIDGIVNASGQLFLLVGGLASFRMSGSVHRYGMAVVVGVIILIFIILV
jgi:NADH-quinone oxidoreductase subunit L